MPSLLSRGDYSNNPIGLLSKLSISPILATSILITSLWVPETDFLNFGYAAPKVPRFYCAAFSLVACNSKTWSKDSGSFYSSPSSIASGSSSLHFTISVTAIEGCFLTF